tara:strand:- start:58 stop:2508 length:2451 start_codon:yes stop_codon:yes gene_type:complete
VKKNRFNKALKHLKSKKLDKKIKKLEEAAPTNSMSGVYQQSPRANAAFRLGELDPPRRFVAAADGSWPAGIPGTAGEPYYDRPAGHWEGTVDWETITEPKFGYNAAQNNNTDGLIDPVTNAVKTQLPPNSRSFILGPLVDGFVPNHVGDAFTRIGYIEKDTRQFVLLGIIQGEWVAGLNEVVTSFGGGSYPVWDGNALRFTQVNPNFTLDMALWFRNEMLKGRFVKNVSYNAVGGIPQAQGTDPNAPQPLGGNGVGGGSGEAGQNPDGTGTGTGEGGNPTQGNEQGDPDPGQDPGENDLWGLLHGLFATGFDFFNNPLKYAIQGILNLGGMIPGYSATATSFNNLVHHTNNNNPNHPDFRKNDPSSSNYEGPAEVNTSNENRQNIVNSLNEIISNLNNGNGPTNPNGNLTNDEIEKLSDEMKNNYMNNPRNQAYNTFYNSFHSLPVGGDRGDGKPVTTVKVNNGEFQELDSNYWFTDPRDANPLASDESIRSSNMHLPSTIISNTIHGVTQQAVENGKWTPGSDGNPFYSDENKTTVIGTQYNTQQSFSAKPPKPKNNQDLNFTTMSYVPNGEVLSERKRILREIRQPLKEIKELPKIQKLKGYRPNFKGKLSPQNTPDVTASKKSDRLVMAKNAEGQAWSVGDKYFKGWETTNRMNHVYSRVGESDKFFEQITANNKSDYDRKLQEHLNHLYHNKAMKLVDSDYVSPFDPIKEQETFDNKVNDPLFTKVAKRLKKEIDYEKKPSPKGYPNEAPPKIDPNTGMHPKYGKKYKYDKLDPQSAEAMPMQGDPEIDANIQRLSDKKAKARKLKNLMGKK